MKVAPYVHTRAYWLDQSFFRTAFWGRSFKLLQLVTSRFVYIINFIPSMVFQSTCNNIPSLEKVLFANNIMFEWEQLTLNKSISVKQIMDNKLLIITKLDFSNNQISYIWFSVECYKMLCILGDQKSNICRFVYYPDSVKKWLTGL